MNESDASVLRHSTAHVMAHAVTNLFPGTKVAIGPSIEDGFYYDFDVERPFTPEDLVAITAEMKKIIKVSNKFVRKEVSREEALNIFADEPYKVELINELPADEVITIFEEGEFVDLCRGPHVERTGKIKAYKLLSAAGAYWRGDEKNKMLQRIYGTAFASQAELDEHLEKIAEAERRDHRKIGKELDFVQYSGRGWPGTCVLAS